jgi:hypothetical protein
MRSHIYDEVYCRVRDFGVSYLIHPNGKITTNKTFSVAILWVATVCNEAIETHIITRLIEACDSFFRSDRSIANLIYSIILYEMHVM